MGFEPTIKTNRGFELINFTDHNGALCSLQQSSLAEYRQPGSSAVWLGCNKNAEPHMGHELSPRMHLTGDQVSELVIYLQRWLETGSFQP